MRRLPPPELPDDDWRPSTEPRGDLDPPRRRPPAAVGTMRRPPRPPSGSSYYGHRLRTMDRVPRLMAGAALLSLTVVGVSAGQLVVSAAAAIVGVRCAWTGVTGEVPGRALRRRLRWYALVRRRIRRGRAIARDPRLRAA